MSRFTIIETPLEGLKLIERIRIGDDRGFLSRLFCSEQLAASGWDKPIAQINHTRTLGTGTVRGMHYQQTPHSEAKLVNCVRGAVWDVAVDLRADSPTFLHWHAELLSEENQRALLIPEGFAHGFQAQEESCELVYLHSAAYQPDAEAGLMPKDTTLDIRWPLTVKGLSKRDENHPLLTNEFQGVQL